MIWTAILIFVTLLVLWAVFVRKWLRSQTWAAPFFAWIEPIEIAIYKKSETILYSRLKALAGFIGFMLPAIGAIDFAPYLPFLWFIPPEYHTFVTALPGALLALDGLIGERLRNGSTKPMALVAAPDNMSPKVAAAVTAAEVSKDKAVAVVEAAEKKEA